MKLKGNLIPKGRIGQKHPSGLHKAPIVWVLIADDHVARLFERTIEGIKPFGEARLAHRAKEVPNRSLGRTAGAGSLRHKLTPHVTADEKDTLSFIQDVATRLDQAANENAFDRLVLAAAPKTLGRLRRLLTAPVQDRIVAEIDKDLTKMGEKALQAELEKIVWF